MFGIAVWSVGFEGKYEAVLVREGVVGFERGESPGDWSGVGLGCRVSPCSATASTSFFTSWG